MLYACPVTQNFSAVNEPQMTDIFEVKYTHTYTLHTPATYTPWAQFLSVSPHNEPLSSYVQILRNVLKHNFH